MKHKLEGIGGAQATLTIAILAGSPLAWLTQGIQGRILHWLLTQIYMRLASTGLVILNIGVARVETIAERKEFDGSFDDAFELINKRQGKLTDAETKKIDDHVIDALRKFTDFGVRNGRDSKH